MTADEIFMYLHDRLLDLAKDGPCREIDLRGYDGDMIDSFMKRYPDDEYDTPGYYELPIGACVKNVDDDGNPSVSHDFFIAVDILSKHYGGPQDGGGTMQALQLIDASFVSSSSWAPR